MVSLLIFFAKKILQDTCEEQVIRAELRWVLKLLSLTSPSVRQITWKTAVPEGHRQQVVRSVGLDDVD